MHIVHGRTSTFLCSRAQVNNGIAKPNWARKETKLASDEKRKPDLPNFQVPPLPPPVEPPQSPQEPPAETTAPLCVAAVAMHGPPPMSNEEREWQEEPTEEASYPNPGFHVSGNLWSLDIADRASKPGPMASFLRHVTSMQSPTNPSYAATGRLPVTDVQCLRTEATLENNAHHQAYLEKLQFEHNTLTSWSNMVQDQIASEAQQVHLQLMQMSQTMQNRANSQPWAHGWASSSAQLPPRPVQRTPQPQVPVKPAPTPRPQPQAQSASASSTRSAQGTYGSKQNQQRASS